MPIHEASKLTATQAQALAEFDRLPDSAGVPVQVAAAHAQVSVVSVWRRIKDGTFEVVRLGGSTRVLVGSIRRAMTGTKPAAPRTTQATAASVKARACKHEEVAA